MCLRHGSDPGSELLGAAITLFQVQIVRHRGVLAVQHAISLQIRGMQAIQLDYLPVNFCRDFLSVLEVGPDGCSEGDVHATFVPGDTTAD